MLFNGMADKMVLKTLSYPPTMTKFENVLGENIEQCRLWRVNRRIFVLLSAKSCDSCRNFCEMALARRIKCSWIPRFIRTFDIFGLLEG